MCVLVQNGRVMNALQAYYIRKPQGFSAYIRL